MTIKRSFLTAFLLSCASILAACSGSVTSLGAQESNDEQLAKEPKKALEGVSIEACRAQGATPRTDPGDGSLKGCNAGETSLGRLSGLIEGGFCCATP
jgi:hypothetical protein